MSKLYSKINLLALFCAIFTAASFAQHSIIPTPAEYTENDGVFVLDNSVILDIQTSDSQIRKDAYAFRDKLNQAGFMVEEGKTSNTRKSIRIIKPRKKNKELSDEGYKLTVSDKVLSIEANTSVGVFYGLQTLYQLLPVEIENGIKFANKSIEIKACEIVDYPRFAWRGLMLDVSRHFFGVDDVKAYIDKMAKYKYNIFHWHLTDDEGWRIEIKSLPKLTEVGAWRVERTGRFGKSRTYPAKGEKATYGGFYTQEQIKEVVAYAKERNITVVPEIDMPGHCMAALAAYPELSVNKEPKFVNPGAKFAEWYEGGKFKMLIENMLNPTDEAVYEFVDKIMKEVAELFPGEYIHMGGDECYHGFWEENKDVQKFMKKNKIKDGKELQNYFVVRVKKIIEKHGKKMIGWDEILDGELEEGSTIMSWRGMKGGIEAAARGYKVVMSPTTYAYLDYTQGDHSLENPIYADLSLKKSYTFNPAPDTIKNFHLIKGGQANLWTEVIPNMQFAFYMTYPRAFAISEALWSPYEKKTWNDFVKRTESHFERFDISKTNICKAVYEPIVELYKKDGKVYCKLTNNIEGVDIYYSIDNTYPVQFGTKYTEPFEIPEAEVMLRAKSFRNGEPLGRELRIKQEDLMKRLK